jgi:hypothetical protein
VLPVASEVAMNIGQLSIVATAAATQSAQARGSEVERVQQEVAVFEREIDSTAEAEAAEGIGVTNEEQAAGDRDADGRRPWEIGVAEAHDKEQDSANPNSSHRAKDPTGQAGSQLDISG